jgi:allantoin racemase
MRKILLINPNSSETTTAMMVAIAAACAPDGVEVICATARRSPGMITTAVALAAAADEVVEIGVREATGFSGIIISAYGDPGLKDLQDRVAIPVVGICEASMIEAAAGRRRFGVATVTPDLVGSIEDAARHLNLSHLFSGVRLTPGDPVELAADPAALQAALADAVRACLDKDRADAVIIGGGPLGQAALALAPMFSAPIVAPIPAAVRRLLEMMAEGVRP